MTNLGKVVLGLVAGITLLGGAVAVHEFLWELDDDFRPPRASMPLDAADAELGFRSVMITPAGGERVAGFYAPGSGERVVVVVHGSGADRRSMMPLARLMVRQGIGVLAIDLAGHGESGGAVHWDEGERLSLRYAIDWLIGDAAGAPRAIGVYGFSMGAMVALQVMVADPRIQALALAGAFTTTRELFAHQSGRKKILASWPWLAATVYGGMRFWRDQPIDLIARVAPRPLLLITGANDKIVPPLMTEQLYAKALAPKDQLTVEGAHHGDYAEVAPADFGAKVAAFFREYLHPQR